MEQSLSQKTLKNSTWNLVTFFATIFFSVFITPYIIHKIGVSAYGLIIIANTIISILSLLEFGIGASLIKSLSEGTENGNNKFIEELMGTMLTLNVLLALLGSLVFIIIANFGSLWFHVPADVSGSVKTLFILAAAAFAAASVSTPFISVLPALQRYDLLSKISIGNIVLLNIAMAVAVKLGYRQQGILALQFASNLGMLIVCFILTKRLLPGVRIKFHFGLAKLSQVASFGIFVFVKNVATQALTHFDKVIVTSVLGPAAVSYYSVPGSVPIKTVGIIQSATDVLFPLTSNLSASGDNQKIKEIYPRVMRNIIILSAACTFAIILFGKKILLFWLGPDFVDHSTIALYYLSITYFFLAIYAPVSSFFLGLGNSKLPAVASVSMFGLNMIFLALLLPRYQISGAAAAYLLGVLIVPIVIVIFERKYLLFKNQWQEYAPLALKLLLVGVVYTAICHWLVLPLVTGLYRLIIFGPVAVVLFLVLYKIFGFMKQEDWQLFKQFFFFAVKRLVGKV